MKQTLSIFYELYNKCYVTAVFTSASLVVSVKQTITNVNLLWIYCCLHLVLQCEAAKKRSIECFCTFCLCSFKIFLFPLCVLPFHCIYCIFSCALHTHCCSHFPLKSIHFNLKPNCSGYFSISQVLYYHDVFFRGLPQSSPVPPHKTFHACPLSHPPAPQCSLRFLHLPWSPYSFEMKGFSCTFPGTWL